MLQDVSSRYRRAFVFLLLSFTLVKCDLFYNAMEGEGVIFEYSYPCSASDVTLQYGNRVPFYRFFEPLTLTVDQTGRFHVQLNISHVSSCLLNLQIDPVQRNDAGAYILLANDNTYIERVGLDVDFHPGKPQCKSEGNHLVGDWMELHCTAPVGSMVGRIQCYQEGTLMPPIRAPLETLRNLEQTILVQQNHQYVFCCSSESREPRERCECNDFIWDPISNIETIATDPCPTTYAPIITALPNGQTPKNGISKSSDATSLQISNEVIFTEPERTDRNLVPWYSPLIAGITVVMITVIMLILVRYRKKIVLVLCGYSMNRQTSKSDVPSKENKTVDLQPAVKVLEAKEEKKEKENEEEDNFIATDKVSDTDSPDSDIQSHESLRKLLSTSD